MQEDIIEQRDIGPLKMFGFLLPSLPGLTIRLGSTFLRFKKNAQKAEKTFKKELIKQGIDKQIAKALTEKYMESSKIQKYFLTMH